jgi:hypothetical protein
MVDLLYLETKQDHLAEKQDSMDRKQDRLDEKLHDHITKAGKRGRG